LENPIRRKILEKLAEESHYPLQLSKELNISQQAIMKHLKVLEDNDLVVSFEERSTLGGPPRKTYISKKRISLRIDVGPNTFDSEVYDYRDIKEDRSEGPSKAEKEIDLDNYKEKFLESQKIDDVKLKLKEYSKIIQDLNNELENLKLKRAKLISLRENIIQESNKIILECCTGYDERKILYYLLTHQDRDIETMSELMEMRIKSIEEIFEKLMKQHLFLDEDEY
jgi:predicted transcriptional regulator